MSARSKKSRGPRVALTHFEIRRGSRLRLRIAIADDALADVGDELGMLFVAIAPGAVSTRTVAAAAAPSASVIAVDAPSAGAITVVDAPSPSEIDVVPGHTAGDDDHHASLRTRFAELFGSLCDTSLADALEIAREERERRSDGGN